MGYRSDVTIIAYPSKRHTGKFAALKLYVDENLPDKFEVVWEGDNRYLHCFIGGVKWYEGYEEVQIYNKVFREWEEMFADPDASKLVDYNTGRDANEPIFHYEFLRIGEEYEDVEYHQSCGADHALNMSRETYVDF